MRAPTTRKVIEFLRRYIADNGIPKQIRTDPGTAFTSKDFKNLCEKYFMKHIKCPVNDHKGNGKVERLIRTINERLRTNQNIILDKDNTGLSEMLYALRGAKKPDNSCPAELQSKRKYTTIKDIITTKPTKNYNVLDNDNTFQLEMSDFPGEQDSEIFVRERARGTTLDGLYKKKKGVIIGETDHTITISNKKRQPTTLSKRDVAITKEPQPSTSKQTARKLHYEQPPESSYQPIKSGQPKKSKKKANLPTEFKRLANWEQLANETTDEEEEKRVRQRAPIKATTTWEKTPKIEPKDSEEEETNSQQSNQSNERPKRDRKTPNYFGNSVMICGIEQPIEYCFSSFDLKQDSQ